MAQKTLVFNGKDNLLDGQAIGKIVNFFYYLDRSSTSGTFADTASSVTIGRYQTGWSENLLRKARFGCKLITGTVADPNYFWNYINENGSTAATIDSATVKLVYAQSVASGSNWVNVDDCSVSRNVAACRATANQVSYSSANSTFVTTSQAVVTIPSGVTDGTEFEFDITQIFKYWQANPTSQKGLVFRISTPTSDSSITASPTTTGKSVPAAGFYVTPIFTITYTPAFPPEARPSAPKILTDSTKTYATTIGLSSPVRTYDAGTTTSVTFPFNFVDTNEVEGDYCYSWQIEVYENSAFTGSPLYTYSQLTTGQPKGDIFHTVPVAQLAKDVQLYWRVRTSDAIGLTPGWGAWSTYPTSGGSSAAVPTFKIQAATVDPGDPGTGPGNPNYATISTFPRNRFRVEFYPMSDTVTAGLELDKADSNPNITPSFDPTPKKDAAGNWKPCAVVHDAKKIGVSHTVNGPGEFFLTLPSNHPQVSAIVPLRTYWRVCRWDETVNVFRIVGEGLVTDTESSPNEIIFYGIDKLAMLQRLVVPADKTMIGSMYTFQNFRLDQIHDTLLPSGGGSETITSFTTTKKKVDSGVAVNKGAYVTLTLATTPTLTAGDAVVVSGLATYNDATLGTINLNGTYYVETVDATAKTIAYRIPIKTTSLAEVADTGGSVKRETFRKTAFSPFQATRQITTGSTANNNLVDVSLSPSDSSYRTVTEKRSVMCDGKDYLTVLSEFADILMAGTTDTIVIENPNIGLPAANPKDLYLGIQYRHMKEADIPSPKFLMRFGNTVRTFTFKPNTALVASSAVVLNYSYDTSAATSVGVYGTKSALNKPLYDNYGLIEIFQRVDDERNDLQFAANLLYNKYPNQVINFAFDINTSQITPFIGYAVGDLISVVLTRRNVSVVDKFSLISQQWIGNEDGYENMNFSFYAQQRASFKVQS
jgi:hypothetical protein